MEHKLFAGYARQVAEPEESIPLGGYNNDAKRFHTAMTEDICITCVALSDEADSTVLMIAADLCVAGFVAELGRKEISRVTGLSEDRILISVSHSHSAPGFIPKELPCVQRYVQKLVEIFGAVAVSALADRKPASMQAGSIETHNLNFVKHYQAMDFTTGELSVIGDQYGSVVGKRLLSHMTQVDPTLHVLKILRPAGKDIVIANFRAHPHFTGGYDKYDLSSDYIGAFRLALEAMTDCHAVYFQGACGNTNSSTRMQAERVYTTCRSYGAGLAAVTLECIGKHLQPVEPTAIETKQLSFCGQINKPDKQLTEAATMINDLWNETFDRALCEEKGVPLGIHSPYHAMALLANLKRTKEQDGLMVLNAVTLGKELAFITFPGEMYDTLSVRIEDDSPFEKTLLLGYCYHHVGYLPSLAAYKYGSYEVDVTRFAPGTGEQVADACVDLLKQLKQ